MPAPKCFKPVCTTPRKARSKAGYPRLMVTVRDRLTREAFQASAADIEVYVQQAAVAQGLTDQLQCPWWYKCLPIDRPTKPATEAQQHALAKARQRKAEIQRESSATRTECSWTRPEAETPYDPSSTEPAVLEPALA